MKQSSTAFYQELPAAVGVMLEQRHGQGGARRCRGTPYHCLGHQDEQQKINNLWPIDDSKHNSQPKIGVGDGGVIGFQYSQSGRLTDPHHLSSQSSKSHVTAASPTLEPYQWCLAREIDMFYLSMRVPIPQILYVKGWMEISNCAMTDRKQIDYS